MSIHPLLRIFEIGTLPSPSSVPNSIGSEIYYPYQKQKKCICGRNVIIHDDMGGIDAVLIDKDTRFYPDHIGGIKHSLISLRMVEALLDLGATGFVAHPVSISSVESKALRRQTSPAYFLLEVTGRVDLDRVLWDGFDGDLCAECGSWRPRAGGKITYGSKTTIPLLDTWDGSDFMKSRNVKSAIDYCTRRIVELARSEKWTGFGVMAMTDGLPRPDLFRDDWDSELAIALDAKFPMSK